jgi:hypothetical protein
MRLERQTVLQTELTGPIDFSAVFTELDHSGRR